MANPDLPEEIMAEIFSRTPAKCVGRCRALSKYWNAHLSTTNFIKKHLISNQQQNIALLTRERKAYIVTSPTKSDEAFHHLSGRWFGIVGSCNGLILLPGEQGKLLLTNPITRKEVIIQERPLIQKSQGFENLQSSFSGFGYDSCSDDYKIIQICSFTSSKYDPDGLSKTVVDVYSVKNGVWKRVDCCYPYDGVVPSMYALSDGSFVNGAVHWIIGRGGYRCCINAFDLANEIFREIPLPKEFVRQLRNDVDGITRMRRCISLSVVGGCLWIVDSFGDGVTEFWIMREYGMVESWVRFRTDIRFHTIAGALCYGKDGKLLCLTNLSCLVVCDTEGGTTKKVVIDGFGHCFVNGRHFAGDCIVHGMTFVDSLVSPEGSSYVEGRGKRLPNMHMTIS